MQEYRHSDVPTTVNTHERIRPQTWQILQSFFPERRGNTTAQRRSSHDSLEIRSQFHERSSDLGPNLSNDNSRSKQSIDLFAHGQNRRPKSLRVPANRSIALAFDGSQQRFNGLPKAPVGRPAHTRQLEISVLQDTFSVWRFRSFALTNVNARARGGEPTALRAPRREQELVPWPRVLHPLV